MYYKANIFFNIDNFPNLKNLQKNWKIFRDEALSLEAPMMKLDRKDKSHGQVAEEIIKEIESGGDYGWMKGWNDGWLQYGLMLFDVAPDPAKEQMPKSIKLLERLHGIQACALNKLKANTVLPVHKHPELAMDDLLQCHIVLDAPDQCYLNVDDEFVQHTNGTAIVFNGAYKHFALNASDEDRTILYIEFQA